MNSSFPEGGHSAILVENSSNIYFYLFSILNYETEQNRKYNGICFSIGHTAEDNIWIYERPHPKKEILQCQNQSHRAYHKFWMKQIRLK